MSQPDEVTVEERAVVHVLDCPRCGHLIPNDDEPGARRGAMSRWDNDTEVCVNCGVAEAMVQARAADRAPEDEQMEAALMAVHPTLGVHRWVIFTNRSIR